MSDIPPPTETTGAGLGLKDRVKDVVRHPINAIKDKKAQKEQANSTPIAAKIDRSEFVPGARTMHASKEGTHGRKREGRLTREVEISEPLANDLADFMYQHLQDLQRASDARVLDGDAHAHERALLQDLKDGGEVNFDKVMDFVTTAKGMAITIQQMDLRTGGEMFGLGMDVSAAWGGKTEEVDREYTVNLDRVAREFRGWRGSARRGIGRFPDRAAGAVGTGVGGVVGGAAGAVGAELLVRIPDAAGVLRTIATTEWMAGGLLGGVGGALAGNVLGKRFLSQNGDIDFKACATGLEAAKSLPQEERDYLRIVAGIDVDDFQVNAATGMVEFARTPDQRQTESIFELQKNVRERLETRRDFFRVIGVARPDTRAVPDQLFTGPNTEHADQVRTRWDRRINEIYNPADPAIAALAPADQLLQYMEARQQVLNEYVEEYMTQVKGKGFDRAKGEWIDQAENVGQLRSRIDQAAADKDRLQKRFKDRKEALIGSDGEGGDAGRLKEGGKPFSRREELQIELDGLTQKIIVDHSKEIDTTPAAGPITTVDELILAHTNALSNDPAVSDLAQREADIDMWVTSQLALIDPAERNPDRSRALIFQSGENSRNELNQLRARLEEQLQKIRQAQLGVTGKQQEIGKFTREELKPIVDQLRADRNYFIGIGFSDANLAAMDIGELMYLINVAHNADVAAGITPPRGWAEGENLQISHRDRLLNAKVESQSRHTYQQADRARTRLRNMGLDSDQIQNLSVSEIQYLINVAHNADVAAGITPPRGWAERNNPRNEVAIEQAKESFLDQNILRGQAYKSVLLDLKREGQRQGDLENAQNNEAFIAEANDVVGLMDNQGELFTRTIDEFRDGDKRDKYFDINPIAADTGDYTQQERDYNPAGAGVPTRAYYEWLNLIFQYQKDPNRGAAFSRASTLLPPAQLARILNESPRLNIGLAPMADLDTVVTSLGLNITAPGVAQATTEYDVRAATVDIINLVRSRIVRNL